MSMGMLMSWESRPVFGCLIVDFVLGSRPPAVSFTLVRLRCDVRFLALVFSCPSSAVLPVLALADITVMT
jgi:hypothetical protein